MGCCGCSNKSSATTAAIFGLIQGLVGLILNGYFLNLYSSYPSDLSRGNLDERLFLFYATRNVEPVVKIILGVAALLHSMWIISSLTLLIGNCNDSVCCIRQWVIITSFIIIGDMLLPIALIGFTITSFMDVVQGINIKVNEGNQYQYQRGPFESYVNSASSYVNDAAADVSLDFYKYYIVLLLSFFKLSLITIIVNICLNVFTNRRAYELNNPRGYVIGTTVTIVQNPAVIGPNMLHPQGTVQVQGFPNVLYAGGGGIPLQAAANFGQVALPDTFPADHPIMEDLKDPLLPPGSEGYLGHSHQRF